MKDKHCKGCIYYSKAYRGWECCTYCVEHEHSRGCPPGEGCTKKETRRKRKK